MSDVELEPWSEALDEFPLTGTEREMFRAALRHATLAPSGHNSQPWLFRFRDNELELLADRTRALPVVDPDDRELIISCGAALAYLQVTLRHFGRHPLVQLLPDPEQEDLLARVVIGEIIDPTDTDHALFRAMPRRRTNRFPFEDRPVPEPVLGKARGAAEREGAWLQTLRGEQEKAGVADLIAEGDHIQMADRKFRRELAAWVHANRSASRDGMPGFSYGMGEVASHLGPLVLRTFDMGTGSAAHDRELAQGSPILAVLWTEGDQVRDWLKAGMALARALLTLQAEGVSASFLNQPVEVPELRLRLARLLGRAGFPQLVLRLGYGRTVRPTPRRSVEDILIGEVGEV